MRFTADSLVRCREFLGLIALLVFALFAWLGTGVAHAAFFLMAFLMLADSRAAWATLSSDRFCRIGALFSVYVLASAAWASGQLPTTTKAQWAAVWPWTSLWLFVVVAWWLKGSWARIWSVLALGTVGLAAGIVRKSDWNLFPRWLAGERYDFGYSELGLAFLSLTALLGLLLFFPRLSALTEKPVPRILGAALVWFLQLFFFFVLIVTQSRGAWGCFLLGLVLIAYFSRVGMGRRVASGSSAHAVIPYAAGMVLLGGLSYYYRDVIFSRFAGEPDVMAHLFALDIEGIPYASWGARIHLTLWAIELFGAHPWFGWGPGTSATLVAPTLYISQWDSGFLAVIREFAHLHNSFLELLVRLGLAGFLLFAAGIHSICDALGSRHARHPLPRDFFIFLKVIALTTVVFNLYDFRILHTDFRFFVWIFGGIAYTFLLHRRADHRFGSAEA